MYSVLVGIEPFSDDEPISIYQKIVEGKKHFSKENDKDSKCLIKHLLNTDTTKRFDYLKNCVKDIARHQFLKNLIGEILFIKKWRLITIHKLNLIVIHLIF